MTSKASSNSGKVGNNEGDQEDAMPRVVRRSAIKRPRAVIHDSSEDEENSSADEEVEDKKPIKRPTVKKESKKQNIKQESNAEGTKKSRSKQPASKRVKLEPTAEEKSEAGVSWADGGDTKPSKKKLKQEDDNEIQVLWDSAEVLADTQHISVQVARNVVHLLEEDNTIPFIARYRRGLTDNMEAEQLRDVKEAYEELKSVQNKVKNVIKQISQAGKLTPDIKIAVLASQSLAELEHVASPFKSGSKRTLAERARALGLEEAAMCMLKGSQNGRSFIEPQSLVKPDTPGLASLQEVETGLQHIIADVISKEQQVLGLIRELKSKEYLMLESHKARAAVGTGKAKKAAATGAKTGAKSGADDGKFANYYQFSVPVKNAKAHQVMALNRGEKLKALTVKIIVPEGFWQKVRRFCEGHFLSTDVYFNKVIRSICEKGIQDAWERLLQPLVTRQVRAELTQRAEKAGLEVFAENLKHLLLAPPLKGRTVLGIDPGFKHGCKVAVVAPSGDLLHTSVIHPHFGKDAKADSAARSLRDIALRFSCDVVALGNGTACRETEAWLGALLADKWFSPLDVAYTVVSEQGASIYSCSPEAKQEFPDLDPNLISAASIARRLQEPLAELVKVEPRHLGVGMYQHDLPDSRLRSTLDEVVQECVSFVGVDLNTASLYLLRRIAGLSDARAKQILTWRTQNGAFVCRQQLLQVKGVGAKTFEQCAGFVRVMAASTGKSTSTSAKGKGKADCSPTPLDSTNVHPEAYSAAQRLMQLSGARLEELGQPQFITKVKACADKKGTAALVAELSLADEQAVLQLVEALTQGPAYDPRARLQGPVFRRGVTSIEDLKPGTELSGCVQNVTHFGAFVDIGVGTNGLVHVSAMQGQRLALGNRVNVKVMSVDMPRRRISLQLVSVQP